jgi:hypothetical protein
MVNRVAELGLGSHDCRDNCSRRSNHLTASAWRVNSRDSRRASSITHQCHEHAVPTRHFRRNSFNAPTRTRTRDSSLGPRRDRPLHHQGFVHNMSIIKAEYDILDLRNTVHEPTTFSPAVTLASYLKDAGAARDVRATLSNSRIPGGGQVIVRERPRGYRVEYGAASNPAATGDVRIQRAIMPRAR